MADANGMCEDCHKRPALSDARFGGRHSATRGSAAGCYDCAGRPMGVVKSPAKKEK